MSQLIPVGTGETTFAAGAFTVASGSWKYLHIKGAAGKNAPAPSGIYFEIARLASNGTDYVVERVVDASDINQYGAIPVGSWAARRLAQPPGNTETAGMDIES